MIAPRRRLLVFTALYAMPLFGLATLRPDLVGLAVLLLALGLALVVYDAWRSWDVLATYRVEVAEVIRLAKGREDTWSFKLFREEDRARELQVGLALPHALGGTSDIQTLTCTKDQASMLVSFQCEPKESGSFFLEQCYLGTPTPFGFWWRRRQIPVAVELRVYLDLMRERKMMAVLFLNREGLGIHAQRQVGQGRDFEKLRRYISGDSLNDVHWKATAKRGFLVTKEFRVERTQEVYVLVDGSRLSGREAAPAHYLKQMVDGEQITILERYLTAALILGLAAEKQGDLFGVLGFANRVQTFVRAKSGRNHFGICRDALFGMTPQPVSPDPEELFRFLRQRLRRRALLIILTHLDDPLTAESFMANIDLVSRRHLVVVAMLKDRQMRPLFSGEPITKADEAYEALGAHMRWRDLKEVGNKLQRKGVHFSLLENEGLCLNLLTQYINIKQRQLI